MDSDESLSSVADVSRSEVLRNPDLLELIFEHFGGGEDSILSTVYQGPRKQHLLWACLTARSFMIPALTILWRHMNSIWPLFLLIPNLKLENGSYKLIGSIDDEDLHRFLFYARFIRVLLVEGETGLKPLSSGLMNEIFNKLERFEPLSSVQQLFVWFDQFGRKEDCLLPLLSLSNVHTLHLKSFMPIGAAISSIFLQYSRFESQFKSIRNLKITGDLSSLDSHLPEFTNLQHLYLSHINAIIIPACLLRGCASSMPFLQTLTLHLFSEIEDQHAFNMSQHEKATFEMLSSLYLAGFSKAIGCVMDIMELPSLRSLVLCVLEGQNRDVSTAISKFIRLNNRTARQTIQEITIAFELTVPMDFDLCPEDFNGLERLESFYFKASSLKISTPQLSKFLGSGEHWLNIRSLSLLYDFPGNPDQTLSIAALAIIAGRCPNLHELRVCIYNPDQSEMLQGVVCARAPHNLHILELITLPEAWDYSDSFIITFASFLYDLFPRLNMTECCGPEGLEYWQAIVIKYVLRGWP